MKDNINEAGCPDTYGVYIHIPFCKQKCFYCDFPSFAGREGLMETYVASLCRDIRVKAQAYCSRAGEIISPATIYVGGGTPTYLPPELLERLLAQIVAGFQLNRKNTDTSAGLASADTYSVSGRAGSGEGPGISALEFTVEANPGTLTAEKLELLRRYGVNRLSLGVQTFNDSSLKRIGRIHSAAEAVESVQMAKAAGFDNISIDLIYGLPGQTLDEVKANLELAMELGIQHLSVYGLQLEEGTVLYRQKEMGRLQLPEDDTIEEMYDYIMDYLPKHGYIRYEISNFALAGRESRHNLSYWRDVPYLGIGAGAHVYWQDLSAEKDAHSPSAGRHGYWQSCRYENPADIKEYIELVEKGKDSWQLEERLSEKEHMEEFCFLGLRTARGINRKEFYIKFDMQLDDVYGERINKLQADGLLKMDSNGIRLTSLGMKYGNQVFCQFLLD